MLERHAVQINKSPNKQLFTVVENGSPHVIVTIILTLIQVENTLQSQTGKCICLNEVEIDQICPAIFSVTVHHNFMLNKKFR